MSVSSEQSEFSGSIVYKAIFLSSVCVSEGKFVSIQSFGGCATFVDGNSYISIVWPEGCLWNEH